MKIHSFLFLDDLLDWLRTEAQKSQREFEQAITSVESRGLSVKYDSGSVSSETKDRSERRNNFSLSSSPSCSQSSLKQSSLNLSVRSTNKERESRNNYSQSSSPSCSQSGLKRSSSVLSVHSTKKEKQHECDDFSDNDELFDSEPFRNLMNSTAVSGIADRENSIDSDNITHDIDGEKENTEGKIEVSEEEKVDEATDKKQVDEVTDKKKVEKATDKKKGEKATDKKKATTKK